MTLVDSSYLEHLCTQMRAGIFRGTTGEGGDGRMAPPSAELPRLRLINVEVEVSRDRRIAEPGHVDAPPRPFPSHKVPLCRHRMEEGGGMRGPGPVRSTIRSRKEITLISTSFAPSPAPPSAILP